MKYKIIMQTQRSIHVLKKLGMFVENYHRF